MQRCWQRCLPEQYRYAIIHLDGFPALRVRTQPPQQVGRKPERKQHLSEEPEWRLLPSCFVDVCVSPTPSKRGHHIVPQLEILETAHPIPQSKRQGEGWGVGGEERERSIKKKKEKKKEEKIYFTFSNLSDFRLLVYSKNDHNCVKSQYQLQRHL